MQFGMSCLRKRIQNYKDMPAIPETMDERLLHTLLYSKRGEGEGVSAQGQRPFFSIALLFIVCFQIFTSSLKIPQVQITRVQKVT